jgi:two-component system, NtrC family, response regulator AtoC
LEPGSSQEIVGESIAMREVLANIRAIAATDVPVLLVGESGTGKKLLARYIHELGTRSTGPFISVDCGAFPRELLHSEIFGHERGAFTGAYTQRRGRLELAHGGSLFLNMITDLPSSLQPGLASFLENGTIQRLGGHATLAVNSRILAASPGHLGQNTSVGSLRPELYLRFLVVGLPPLRNRKEDIPTLTGLFLKKYTAKHKRPVRGLLGEAQELLVKYNYPGNVRELEVLVEKAVVLATKDYLSCNDFPIPTTRGEATAGGGMRELVHEKERTAILEALVRANWVQTKAAVTLGISERMLRYKMKKFGITRQAG